MRPVLGQRVFVADGARIIGDVEIGAEAGIWFNCVLRGDVNYIRVGPRTNIQDGTIVHVNRRLYPCLIGADITIGHKALIHACTLMDGCFIGMGATVMDGAVVESGAMVAAGALVPPGKCVPAGEVWAGSPARRMRDVTDADRTVFAETARHYVALAASYLDAGSEISFAP
ncbi:MAG: gamma carbonic anhydrase family protein [Alphaproteobacteria bacterium]|nr:gamma carbonic anhydrase family protein [Alphaproteobacteria bacterium]